MAELSAEMMADRGAALATDLTALATRVTTVEGVADAAVTSSELTAALAPKANQTDLTALTGRVTTVEGVAATAVQPAALAAYATNSDVLVTVSGTTYTIGAGDLGKVLRFTSATAVTVTIPAAFAVGFNLIWRQVGAGQITFAPVGGVTMRSFGNATKSAGQYAEGALAVDTTDVWFLSGTTV